MIWKIENLKKLFNIVQQRINSEYVCGVTAIREN